MSTMSDAESTELGRPRRYKSATELQAAVDRYFDEADKPTMSGLAYALGFEDRDSFARYEEYGPDFSRTVKRARLRIEQDRHERLIDRDKFTAGVIFDLKNNHGWKDMSQQELSGPNGGPIDVREVVLRGVRSDARD